MSLKDKIGGFIDGIKEKRTDQINEKLQRECVELINLLNPLGRKELDFDLTYLVGDERILTEGILKGEIYFGNLALEEKKTVNQILNSIYEHKSHK